MTQTLYNRVLLLVLIAILVCVVVLAVIFVVVLVAIVFPWGHLHLVIRVQ